MSYPSDSNRLYHLGYCLGIDYMRFWKERDRFSDAYTRLRSTIKPQADCPLFVAGFCTAMKNHYEHYTTSLCDAAPVS